MACGFCIIEDDVSFTADTGEGFAEAYHVTTIVGSDAGLSLQTKTIATSGIITSDNLLTHTVGGNDYHGEVFFAMIGTTLSRRIFHIT